MGRRLWLHLSNSMSLDVSYTFDWLNKFPGLAEDQLETNFSWIVGSDDNMTTCLHDSWKVGV